MVQGRLEISARKNPLEVYRKSARVPPADSARKNPLEVSRKSARVSPYTTYDGLESPMLNTKFRGNRPTGSGEDV